MKSRTILMRIGILSMSLTLLLCIGFTYCTKLRNPVFLKNCIETEAVSKQSVSYYHILLQLKYLTSSYDQRKVVGLTFKEAPEFDFSVTETSPDSSFIPIASIGNSVTNNIGELYGRYSLRTIYVSMNNRFHEEWTGEKEVNTAEIEFNNGDRMTADIGRIIIYSDKVNAGDFDQKYSSSSNNGNSTSLYNANRDITLSVIKSPLLDSVSDVLKLTVEGEDYRKISGMQYKVGENLDIKTYFPPIENNMGAYDYYDIRPKLYYKDANGVEKMLRIYNIRRDIYFNDFLEVLGYLYQRGDL